MNTRTTNFLLNVGHAIDHMFLLIFATAVTSIATEFGLQRWEDLMPYGVAAFFFFGLGSLPSGHAGDRWGRRPMMIVFFAGMGMSAILAGSSGSPLALALNLALLGCFASIYHPVGIPMLVRDAARPGWTIGVNGLSGNLGIAMAAVVTGLLVKYAGWRMAFVVPGVISLVLALVFAWVVPRELSGGAKKAKPAAAAASGGLPRLLLVMTVAATTGSLIFNFSTNSNYEMLAERLAGISRDPAQLGLLLASVYAVASFAQLLVGWAIDRFPLKPLYLTVIAVQASLLVLSTFTHGWWFYAVQLLFMASIFGAIPFTDAMIVRYVDDRMRSRVAGVRLAIACGVTSNGGFWRYARYSAPRASMNGDRSRPCTGTDRSPSRARGARSRCSRCRRRPATRAPHPRRPRARAAATSSSSSRVDR